MDTNSASQNKSTNGHTQATLDILANAVAVGKFTQDQADNLLAFSSTDPNVLQSMKSVIKTTPIKPERLDGKYHHTFITLAATKSYDDINKEDDCGLRNMKANAPELYKAKFYEKYGRLPGDVA